MLTQHLRCGQEWLFAEFRRSTLSRFVRLQKM
jgi:hypothetical protein